MKRYYIDTAKLKKIPLKSVTEELVIRRFNEQYVLSGFDKQEIRSIQIAMAKLCVLYQFDVSYQPGINEISKPYLDELTERGLVHKIARGEGSGLFYRAAHALDAHYFFLAYCKSDNLSVATTASTIIKNYFWSEDKQFNAGQYAVDLEMIIRSIGTGESIINYKILFEQILMDNKPFTTFVKINLPLLNYFFITVANFPNLVEKAISYWQELSRLSDIKFALLNIEGV